MNNTELQKEIGELKIYIEVLAKLIADQQLLMIQFSAHQQSHLAAMRDLLKREGEGSGMLDQRLQSAYQAAINLFHDQLEAYKKSGDVRELLGIPQASPNLGEN